MKTRLMLAVAVLGLFVMAQGVRAESEFRLGVGVNYWTVIDDLDEEDFDDDGLSWLITSQYRAASMLKLELDLEIFPDDFMGIDGTAYAPQAYLVLGSTIYAAAGAGIYYADGDFADDPFFAFRAGLDLEILPQIYLDLNVNYRFADTSDLSDDNTDIDGDTLTLGAAARFEF